jgi:competence protein ComEC
VGAKWIVGKPDTFRIVIYFAVIIYLYIAHNHGVNISKKKECVERGIDIMLPIGLRYITVLIAVLFISGRAVSQSSINFIDVGQGDSIYVEGKDGARFLIDAGSTSNSQVAKYTIVPYLKYRGVSKLDAVFLTHLDKDHTSGIIDMLDQEGVLDYNIEIGKIFIADSVIEDEAYIELSGLCRKKNIPIYRLKTGDKIGYGDVIFEVLHPSRDYIPDSRNAYSLVMKLGIGDENEKVTALLTGDVSEDGERIVAGYLDGDIDIYKAAHHGSKYSNKSGIINAANPSLAVISCGEGNSYGHPHLEAVENFKNVGSNVIVTKDTGAISIKIKNGDYKVETYLND